MLKELNERILEMSTHGLKKEMSVSNLSNTIQTHSFIFKGIGNIIRVYVNFFFATIDDQQKYIVYFSNVLGIHLLITHYQINNGYYDFIFFRFFSHCHIMLEIERVSSNNTKLC